MDPVTHTMVGATLADAGGRKYTPLAMPTLILAANIPDIDVVALFAGPYVGLAWRRGLTHGIPAMVVLPFVVLGVMLVVDRALRRRRPELPPIRPGPTLLLACLGVLTHPVLDWLNTYGMRWLAPLDGRWFHGDAVFIIDPWLWLGLGGTLFLLHSRRVSALLAWGALAAAMSWLVLSQPIVPTAARVVWGVGIVTLVLVRFTREVDGVRLARIAVAGTMLYIGAMTTLSFAAEREVRQALQARGVVEVGDVMVGPEPSNPFAGTVVAATPEGYELGSFGWFRSPRFRFERTLASSPPSPQIEAALSTDDARNFLVWSRFPFYEVRSTEEGYTVRIGDARYADRIGAGSLAGVTVRLDRELRPR